MISFRGAVTDVHRQCPCNDRTRGRMAGGAERGRSAIRGIAGARAVRGRPRAVDSGRVVIDAAGSASSPAFRRSLTVPVRATSEIFVDFDEASRVVHEHGAQSAGGLHPGALAIVFAGSGLASLAAAALTGLAASDRYSRVLEHCAGPCTGMYANDVTAGETLRDVTNVLVVAGGVLLVGAIVAALVHASPAPESQRATRRRTSPIARLRSV